MAYAAAVVESVDTGDLKSPGSDTVRVRVPSAAPEYLPLLDTFRSARVGIFICTFTPKQGKFPNFTTHFLFCCPAIVVLQCIWNAETLHIALSIR